MIRAGEREALVPCDFLVQPKEVVRSSTQSRKAKFGERAGGMGVGHQRLAPALFRSVPTLYSHGRYLDFHSFR